MGTETGTAICAWCGAAFPVLARPGPTPRYCRPSHRQRAHEARRQPAGDLGAALDALEAARAVHAEHAPVVLVAAVDGVLLAAGGRANPSRDDSPSPVLGQPSTGPAAGTGEAAPRRPRRSRPKPWAMVRYPKLGRPDQPDWVYGHAPTEAGARRGLATLRRTFERAHTYAESDRWAWAVVHDPDVRLVNLVTVTASTNTLNGDQRTIPAQGGGEEVMAPEG